MRLYSFRASEARRRDVVFTEDDQMPGSHFSVRVRSREAPWEAAMVFQARDGGGLGSGGGSGFGQK